MNQRNPFAWQSLKVADEQTVITDVAEFLYPNKFRKGGHERKKARESIRSAINIYRRKKSLAPLVSRNPNSLLVQDFLAFACNRWPSLQTVIPSHGATVQLFPPEPMRGQVGNPDALILNLPQTYDELLAEHLKVLEARRDEKVRREKAERRLEKYKRAEEKRRKDGAKRYE